MPKKTLFITVVVALVLLLLASDSLAQTCFGRPAGAPNVCQGNGQCVADDTCLCDCGFAGPQCGQIQCFGLNSGNANVCSGNGQ